MPEDKDIAEFYDKQTGQKKCPGNMVEAYGQRAELLRKIGVIGPEIKKVNEPENMLQDSSPDDTEEPYERKDDDPTEILSEDDSESAEKPNIKHLGGGWYLLPNGEKVHGKDDALAALAELQK